MTVGVIAHLGNPTPGDIRDLARAAEESGADWLGIADAFWWRDCWMLLAEAARVTERIAIGPMVTNPYLRHPFHTASALATLQELVGDPSRVLCGLAAGGSEVSGAAGISRSDAPARIEGLATLLRRVAAGGPLDERSGRRLDVPLAPTTIAVAGRGARVLGAAGRCADRAVLWAVPRSELAASAAQIRQGAASAGRESGPALCWAPLVAHHEADRERAKVIAAYGVLNANTRLRARWGVGPDLVAAIRAELVRGGAEAAVHLVPQSVVEDVLLGEPAPEDVAEIGRSIGASEVAFPAYAVDEVAERTAWAREVVSRLRA